MSRNQLFVLPEATLTLYRADSAGNALADQVVWFGACAEDVRFDPHAFNEVEVQGTGRDQPRVWQLNRILGLQIRRLWVVPLLAMTDFAPDRNQRYVLAIVWDDERHNRWHRRTYYGVTASAWGMTNLGYAQFYSDQVFRAERYASQSGLGVYPSGTPGGPSGGEATQVDQNVAFFHDGPMMVGDYCTGHYAWASAVTLAAASVIAMASQGVATVLELEVDGILTGLTLTIPEGESLVEVEGSATLDREVAAGATIRWKVVSGPAEAENAAQVAAVTVRLV